LCYAVDTPPAACSFSVDVPDGIVTGRSFSVGAITDYLCSVATEFVTPAGMLDAYL
jgi:hypothetical protein